MNTSKIVKVLIALDYDPTAQTVAEGDFADAILKTSKDLDADIIVMGSHSRQWLEKIILGSVTEKVLKITTLPLFIIPIKKHN
jgi:nucleotide-binding universal stress UspA family protein